MPIATPQRKPFDRWRHWYSRVFPAYLVFLFLVQHLPHPGALPGGASDKHVHVIAFGVLAFFFWRFIEATTGRISHQFILVAIPLLLLYAAFDEYTQQYFDRSTDIADWIADALGIVVVCALLEWHRRRARS
ncbi:MAG: VanZ family protein [Phycisphaerae bacterium]